MSINERFIYLLHFLHHMATQETINEINQVHECFDCGVTEWTADHKFRKIKDTDGSNFYCCNECERAIVNEASGAYAGINS